MNNLSDQDIADLMEDGKALRELGKYYFHRQNGTKAIAWFRRALDAHDHGVRIWLAWCFLRGYGCCADQRLAESYVDKALCAGEGEAMTANELYSFGCDLAGDFIDTFYHGIRLLDEASRRGSVDAAVALGEYYASPVNQDGSLDAAIRYLFPVREKSNYAKNILYGLYMRLSPQGTRKYAAQGLYDESVLNPEDRHPRYWLDGDCLIVKKNQYDNWIHWQNTHSPLVHGYWGVGSIKAGWINDCLEDMDEEVRRMYLEGLGINPDAWKCGQDIDIDKWKMIVRARDGDFLVVQKQKYGKPELISLEGNGEC